MTRHAARFYAIQRRNGDRLFDTSHVPWQWSDRGAIAFPTKPLAELFIFTAWGVTIARERGIYAVKF